MYKDIEDIMSVIASDKDFCQMLINVDDISIIEWDGNIVYGSQAMSAYFEENHISKDKIKDIYLLGKKNANIISNTAELKNMFPQANLIVSGKDWRNIDADKLGVHNTFVVHFASTTPQNAEKVGKGNKQERRIINDTRCAYYAVVSKMGNGGLFDNTYSSFVKNTLTDFDPIKWVDANTQTPFCKNRLNMLANLETSSCLSQASTFSSYIEELKNGCSECSQCLFYKKDKQCPEAQMVIARQYRNGLYVPENETIAHQLTVKATNQGYIPAILQMSKDKCNGYACEKDIAYAVNYLNAFAKMGYEECARLMIEIINNNKEYNSIKSVMVVPYIVAFAENKDKDMATMLANAFDNGAFGLPRSVIQKNYWRLQADIMEHSRPIQTDEEKYQEYLQKAEEGELRCMELICEEYYNGNYLPKDYKKSVEWGMKALDQGSKNVRFRLAWLLDGQDGVEPNYEKAYKLYNELAEEGDSAAMNNIGWMHERGHYVEKNCQEAFDWYLRAANIGDDVAMKNVANMLWYGQGVEQNLEDAVKWYQMAVDAGLDSYLVNLGYAYETGKGVAQDYEKAIKYFRQAAEKDNTVGFYNLGIMYHYGKGIDKNTDTAIYWYRKAAAKGYVNAKEQLKKLNANWVDENGKVTDKI